MPRKTIQDSNAVYEVELVELKAGDSPSGMFGTRRKDTGAVLGIASERYEIVQNGLLMATTEEALQALGFPNYDKRVVVMGKGERMIAEYTLGKSKLEAATGDIFAQRITLRNSFDRTWCFGHLAGLLRKICSNGACVLESAQAKMLRHYSQPDVGAFAEGIRAVIASGQETLAVYGELASVEIGQLEGSNILAHMVERKILTKALSEPIGMLWENPRRQEDKARNLYNLNNAITEYATHYVSPDRYLHGQRIIQDSLEFLASVIKNENVFAGLLEAPKA